jgi:hypothetical protein
VFAIERAVLISDVDTDATETDDRVAQMPPRSPTPPPTASARPASHRVELPRVPSSPTSDDRGEAEPATAPGPEPDDAHGSADNNAGADPPSQAAALPISFVEEWETAISHLQRGLTAFKNGSTSARSAKAVSAARTVSRLAEKYFEILGNKK